MPSIRAKNKVQQLTTAVTVPVNSKQKITVAKSTATKTPSTSSTRATTTASKVVTKPTKTTTSVTPKCATSSNEDRYSHNTKN